MRTPLLALNWELYRITRWDLLFRVVTMCVFVAVVFGPFMPASNQQLPPQFGRGIIWVMMFIVSVFSVTWMNALDSERVGFSFRLLFVRPLSTAQMVVVPLAYAVGSALVCLWVPALFAHVALGVDLFSWRLTLIAACAVTYFVCATWSPASFLGRWGAFAGVIAALAAGFALANANRAGSEPVLLAMDEVIEFPAWGYVALVLLAVGAVLGTVRAVDRQRHGAVLQLPDIRRLGDYLPTYVPARAAAFSSPRTAQCWYEMRRGGVKILGVGGLSAIGLFLGILCLHALVPSLRAHTFRLERIEDFAPLWLLALCLSPLVYLMLGVEWTLGLRKRQGTIDLSTFDATCGLADDVLIAIKLLVVAGCSFAAWLMLAAAAALQALLFGQSESWSRISEGLAKLLQAAPPLWYLAAAVSALLLFVALGALLMTFGMWIPRHGKLMGTISLFGLIHICLLAWDARHKWPLAPLWQFYAWLLAALIVAISVTALVRAARLGMLRKPWFALIAGGWLAYVYLALTISRQPVVSESQIPLTAYVLAAAAMTVPLSAIPLAAQALAAQRHQ